MRTLLVIAALFFATHAAAEVPDCFEYNAREYVDGTTNKGDGGSGMYNTDFYRGWVWWLVQQLDTSERRKARSDERIAGWIGPCVMSDGSLYHLLDKQ